MTVVARVAMGAALAAAFVLALPSAALSPARPESQRPAHPTQEYCNIHFGQPVGEVFTWRGWSLQEYLGDAACENHRQGTYLGSNVAVDPSGDLVISTRRHCTTEPVSENTPSFEGPCPTTQSQYSVGRVRLARFEVPDTDFEWGFEARLPADHAPGARSALWLINLDRIHCEELWGELDVVEWYSSRPDVPESATHLTCRDSTYASWHHKRSTWDWGEAGSSGFHRWAVRKQVQGDKTVISYLYDDRVHATDTCEDRLSPGDCAAVLDRAWTAILQTAVFADDDGPFTRPADDGSFPTQELVIRSMWIRPL